MKSLAVSELRRNLSATIDSVAADGEPVLVRRGRGKPPAVIVSLADWGAGAADETAYLLASPANAERLMESIGRLGARKGSRRSASS